jgi:DNA-directed RNA polymerase subunit RPC12/RpoP
VCKNCGIAFEQPDNGRRRLCRDCRADGGKR